MASIEAIVDELKQNNLMMMSDEYGLALQKQGYMAELKGFLTEVFGNPAQISSSFRKDGSKGNPARSSAENPCINVLGCSTVEYLKLSSDHQAGGFFGRHLIWLSDSSDVRLPFSKQVDDDEWNAVFRKLLAISKMKGAMSYSQEAIEVIETNYRKIPGDASAAEGSQLSRISDYWKKLSMIFAASDGRMEIHGRDAQMAVDLCEWLFKNYCILLGKMNDGDIDRKGDQLLQLLAKNGNSLHQGEILKLLHIKTNDLKELESRYEGQIEIEDGKPGRNGKKPRIWKLVVTAPKKKQAVPPKATPAPAVATKPTPAVEANPSAKATSPAEVPFKYKIVGFGPKSKGDTQTPELDFGSSPIA